MIEMTWRNSLPRAVAAVALLASAQLANADEMSTILGPCDGQTCAPSPGNTLSLTQQGTSNSASAEQQALGSGYGNNAAGIAQTGDHNSVTLNQPGGVSASVTQTGNYLGLNLTQGQNTSIGVTQFGNGAGLAPLTITTVK